eukprot:CAMPEP_0177663874 /NCGR_PEP_ID=MMETSP0447-20121125/20163_1 /TAXON_ID=0 /ORGANISM="Stygamoeba regulata, Strain BSH-02190019" /LENGTH=226 /DNA_ID=CAMNT_0019169749 /DNA_START=32 /DNA_END=712 /DNA_ORIENTATION=+
MANMVKAYLVLYNVAQFIGWSCILFSLVRSLIQNEGDTFGVWAACGDLLVYFQFAAVLEVIHPLLGLVKTPVSTTAIQVASRVMLTTIALFVPPAQSHWVVALMIGSWSLTEVVRYLYYATNQLDVAPWALTYLRYSLFLVLYPSGVAGEIGTILVSLPYFKETQLWSFPITDSIYFSFYYFLMAALVLYLPGLPVMYMHMLSQRRRVLSPRKPSNNRPSQKKKQK